MFLRKLLSLSLILLISITVVGTLWKKIFFEQNENNRPTFTRENIVLERKDGSTVSFDVEVALTPSQHAYGLMFKRDLKPHEGMLFVFDTPQIASFWMKNTSLPLDMIFIKPNGQIAQITQAKPFDLTPITTKEPVSYVLEINQTESLKREIDTDTRLRLKSKRLAP